MPWAIKKPDGTLQDYEVFANPQLAWETLILIKIAVNCPGLMDIGTWKPPVTHIIGFYDDLKNQGYLAVEVELKEVEK